MDLRKSFERFADKQLQRWDPVNDVFIETDIFGSLQVYDRFISDRDFGQKKRLFLVPGEITLDLDKLILKIKDMPSVWLLEGKNIDTDGTGNYATSAVLREGRYRLNLKKVTGTKRANGVGFVTKTEQLIASTWGDFSRFSSTESRELENIDYTIGYWYLPRGVPVDLDTIIEDSMSQTFQVREVSSFLDLQMVKVQEVEKLP